MSLAELATLRPNFDVTTFSDELELVRHACKRFDVQAFREGHLTPVFFGSALKNFGVGDLLNALGSVAPPPRAQTADTRVVAATEAAMSAFVFKVQANMDPNHRDRIAFVRLCSGKLTRGMKVKQVRTGKVISLHAPQFFFAQERALVEEAYAGDVVGIPNHGTLRIGDTLTEGEDLNFVGIPSFAPEILRRVRLPDAMKAKKLAQALQQLAEEGVVQVFRPNDGSPAFIGVVGPLQLDVLQERLASEYGLETSWDVSEFQLARWITAEDRNTIDQFVAAHRSAIALDMDGDVVFLARSAFDLDYTGRQNRRISFNEVKDIHAYVEMGQKRTRSSPRREAPLQVI
jgi:peptide chain release factor 3